MGSYAQKAVFKRVYKAPKQSEVIILAKDGTARGGARPGSGPKRKALTEKISAGKTAQVIELPEGASLEGVDMPPVKEYMKAKKRRRPVRRGDFCGNLGVAEKSRLHGLCEYAACQPVRHVGCPSNPV